MDPAAVAPEGVRLPLAGSDFTAALAVVPKSSGVAQVFGPDGRALVTARAANLRRFLDGKLSAPKPPAAGRRPPVDLRPLARALRYAVTCSPFEQRLVYERWMAALVPLRQRRDLKPPAYLHLDPRERFPRVSVQPVETAGPLFGPFRDKRAAERALKPLHKLFPLRPCDYTFEPHAELPLGLNCLYAQVRSCAAPCLARVSADEYRALAGQAAALLADPERRPAETREWAPAWIGDARGPAVVVERTRRGLRLYPVRAGAVLEEHAVGVEGRDARVEDALADGLERLLDVSAAAPPPGRDDTAWLTAFFHARPRGTAWVVLPAAGSRDELRRRVRAALE